MRWLKTIWRFLKLFGKLGALGTMYFLHRRKGQSAFRKELRRMGIDKSTIKELSQSYKSLGDPRQYMRYKKKADTNNEMKSETLDENLVQEHTTKAQA